MQRSAHLPFGPVPAAFVFTLAAALLVGSPLTPVAPAQAGERPMIFSDDQAPPPILPVPLDRYFQGEIVSFKGGRLKLRWTWEYDEHLQDFEQFVPVRKSLDGGFKWTKRHLEARGTGGLRLRFGFQSDVQVRVDATLTDPHDLGVVLAKADASDESILCLIQDRFFTQFDKSAGNATMINKMGGIPPETPGVVEFRYVDRKPQNGLKRGDEVRFEVDRKGRITTFRVGKSKGKLLALSGEDPTPSFDAFCPGLYTSGGSATFHALEIEGAIRPEWCKENDVLPHVIDDLLHPGNGFKGVTKTWAKVVKQFLAQPDEPPEPVEGKEPAPRVDPEAVVRVVGMEKLPLVIRIRAAEALLEKGYSDAAVERRVAQLLDAGSLPTRVLAWQVLRPQLPWHFNYQPDAEAKVRREGALLVAHYMNEYEDAQAEGKVFVTGYWYTPHRADEIRAAWKNAWDLRTSHVRVRTNLPYAWAVWYRDALEAQYHEMVRQLGREPPPERLPLSTLVFRSKDGFSKFCLENGYGGKEAWGRFVDVENGVGFVTFDKRYAPFFALNMQAKAFLFAATDTYWPTWFDEGRGSFLGDGHRRTAKWDGKRLRVGLPASGPSMRAFKMSARQKMPWTIATFLQDDPRDLDGVRRAKWYTFAWALHHWLTVEATAEYADIYARWQGLVENSAAGPRVVNDVSRKQFLSLFASKLETLETQFSEWLKTD